MIKGKTFPLDKILTMSAGDWIEQHSGQYSMVGVHYHDHVLAAHSMSGFAEQVPKNAVVVTDLRVVVAQGWAEHYSSYAISGVALIPDQSER